MIRSANSCVYMWPGHNFTSAHEEDIIKYSSNVDTTKYISTNFSATWNTTCNHNVVPTHRLSYKKLPPMPIPSTLWNSDWLTHWWFMKSQHLPSLVKADLSHCCHLGSSCQEQTLQTRQKPSDLSDAEGLTCLLLASQSIDRNLISDIYK